MAPSGFQRIKSGCTREHVELSRNKKTGVFILNMVAGKKNPENRWTLELLRAIHKAYDVVETCLLTDKPGRSAALISTCSSKKFFSNGIDPKWVTNPKTPISDLHEWNNLAMSSFARPMLLSCPTICAVNGHAIGAGFMYALGHDHRIQQTNRGFLCAIEVAIGFPTPIAELTLFKHAMPADAFYQTVLEAKKWGAEDAVARGVVQQAVPPKKLLATALSTAYKLAKLNRAGVYGYHKWHSKGYVAKEILEALFPGGEKRGEVELPPGLEALVKSIVVENRIPDIGKSRSFIKAKF